MSGPGSHSTAHLSPITSHFSRSDLVGAVAAGSVVIAFCLLLVWHDPVVFWNDDYQLSILPVFADVARSWAEGHWPLLSSYSWVCNNLAGEFQYGTFSIFVNAAVVSIWKFPLTFAQQAAALSITHLVVLAIGAFLLARGRDLSLPLSVFVTLIAALNGWMICWGAIDWFGALGAFAWLPWAWWAAERAFDPRRSRWRFLWPAPFVYLVISGGFPYTVLMLALVMAWLSVKSLAQTKSILSILPMLFGMALGVGLSAPSWLALLDYVHGSARAMEAARAHLQWLVPPAALPALILPAWTVNWTDFSTRSLPHTATELACGLVAPSALISGLIWRPRLLLRQFKWELLLLLLVLLLAMIPTAGVFRWSFRWLPLFHLVLALCAAHGLRDRQAAGLVALLLVGLAAVTMSFFGTTGEYAFPLTWILLLLAAFWAALELKHRTEWVHAWMPAGISFAVLLATYVCIPPNCGVPKYNFSQQLLAPGPLDPQRLYLSIYPPVEHTYRVEKKPQPIGQLVRPGSTSMWAKLRFVNGYSPILAAGAAREFGFAIHGEIDPAMGDYLLGDQSGLLEQLGVNGLVVAQEIATNPASPDWQLVFSNDEGRVFHRRGAPLPHVRSVNWIDSRRNEAFATAAISRIDDSQNRVELDVDVPNGENAALLEFSRPYFRGYAARLGNVDLAVNSYRGLIPLVQVPPGSHGRLVLAYQPAWLIYGSVLSILCAVGCAASVVAATVSWWQNLRMPLRTAASTAN